MAYDCYVAMCHPLHYTTIMREELCAFLVAVSWLLFGASSLSHGLLLTQLSFCSDNIIPHFFSDLGALLKFSCSDIVLNELVMFSSVVVVITLPFICILVSYGYIGATILRIPSTTDKALSTCGSHLSLVSLYYGSIFGQYLFLTLTNFIDKDIIVVLMYTVVTPMLNPFIYSLRKKDIKRAFEKLFSRAIFFSP